MKLKRRNLLTVAAIFWGIYFSCFFILLHNVYAADISFSWLPNSETDLKGYKIHYGEVSGNYTDSVDCGLPEIIDGRVQYTITDLPDGLLYYACTAYDNEQESDYSNELFLDPIPLAPVELQGVSVTTTTTTTTTINTN